MTLPLFPENTRETIEEIINMIGRDVTFYGVVSLSGCYACNLDPVAGTSTNSFCPVCSGDYWIPTYSGATLTAHITYGQVDNNNWQTGGIINDGSVTAKVMHSGWVEEWINQTEYVVLDDREYDVVNVDIRGVQPINRILVKLKEKER
jgi:hypothetical protein